MSIIVGVDAGGSGTRVVVADGERIIGAAESDPANARTAGIEAAADAIAFAVRSATGASAPDALCVGAAGAGSPSIAAALEAALRARLPGACVAVTDDARIALRAGAPEGDALALIAGTGSIAYAEIAGRLYRAGGYGYLLGDEGSGAAIGIAAVRLLLRSYDGRAPRDAFLERIEAGLDGRDAHDIIARVADDTSPVRLLASLAPAVLTAAAQGERSATKIVQAAALELFDLLKSVVRQAAIGTREMPVVFGGSLLLRNSMLTYLVETRITNEFPFLNVRKDVQPPEFGALALARVLST